MKTKPLISLKILLGILVSGILVYNFYVANNLKYETGGDAVSFIGLGLSLAEFQKYGHIKVSEGSLMEAFKNKQISWEEISFVGKSTWRPPVWPFLIAGIFLIFGYNLTYLLIFKFLLHLLGIFIFYKTLKLLKIKEVLILAGCFLYAIHPAWQLYSRVFLSEPITFFFMSLWVYLLVRYFQHKKGFIMQSLVAGIMILAHPYYIFLPFSIWLILFIKKQIPFKSLFLSSLICTAIVFSWVIRNSIVLDTSELILTTSSGAVMAKGWNEDVPRLHTNTKGDLADETLVLKDYEYKPEKSNNEVERMELYKNASLHFIKTNPDLVLPIIWKKLKSAFNPFPETPRPGVLETGRIIFQVLALFSLLYLLIFSRNKLLRSLVIGLVLSTIGITIITYSGFRFRMPQVGLELLLLIGMLGEVLPTLRKKIPKG
ncbi:ArnT family glycosyltransferase [Salegentibacter sediminis]|uniref:ArnT family glycosyltransferase n=1 Tax=Salegentibacter sediminis TaxID=1930251 RepID=UPI0009BEB541|nr:glycosyltransferase family 39 protein [Salegentibacter sediminis]